VHWSADYLEWNLRTATRVVGSAPLIWL
jgi:hypothetical protein